MFNYIKHEEINNTNITSFKEILTPNELINEYPANEEIKEFIKITRKEIINILNNKDNRKLLIVGPCSIHNIEEAKKYADMLKILNGKVSDKIKIVMRVYFEKPRTITGWKGLINDPDLDESYNIDKGLRSARDLLLYLAKNEIPAAYEMLDTFTPQYIADLISWSAVGARTTESQVHRQLVSGLSMPVGFKNSTNGDCKVALDAIKSAEHKHCFYGITYDGKASMISTKGNKNSHIILRGSNIKPNYYKEDIEELEKLKKKNDSSTKIIIDCSHGNSQKDYKKQSLVIDYIIEHHLNNKNIIGYMLESNIKEGNQKIDEKDKLKYGVSITDSCISFEETIKLVIKLYDNIRC